MAEDLNNLEEEKQTRAKLRANTYSSARSLAFVLFLILFLFLFSLILQLFGQIQWLLTIMYLGLLPSGFIMMSGLATLGYEMFDTRGIDLPRNIYFGDRRPLRIAENPVFSRFVILEFIEGE